MACLPLNFVWYAGMWFEVWYYMTGIFEYVNRHTYKDKSMDRKIITYGSVDYGSATKTSIEKIETF